MKNLLFVITLLCLNIPVFAGDKYPHNARSITPKRSWVKSVDTTQWYYGYAEGSTFYYVRTYLGGLSDLSSMYPHSYRAGEMRQLPRYTFVYESYQTQFDRALAQSITQYNDEIKRGMTRPGGVKEKVFEYPVPVKDKTSVQWHKSEGFDWLFKPGKHHEDDFNWNACRCGGGCDCGIFCRCK